MLQIHCELKNFGPGEHWLQENQYFQFTVIYKLPLTVCI